MNAGPSGPGNGVPVKIKFDRLIAYSTLQLPLAMAALPVVLNVSHFYGEVLKVPLGVMGLIFIAARVIDAIQDPVIGLISDKFTHRGPRGRLEEHLCGPHLDRGEAEQRERLYAL